MKLFRKFLNTLKEGLKSIWKHKNLGFVSITSTFFTLLVMGIIILITVSINNFAHQIQTRVNDVEIFIKNDASDFEIEMLKEEIDSIDIPKKVTFRSSDEAMEIMKDSWGENANLLDEVDYEGLLPSSYIVSLENIEQADDFVSSIKDNTSIEDINYYKELVEQIYRLSNYVKIFGTILVMILMVVSLFIISNTIRLTVMSRIQEIAVMKNVGATNNYIRIPFIIEGVFYSVLASLLAFIAIFYLYRFIYFNFGSRLADSFSVLNLIKPSLLKMKLLQIFLALGVGIGVLGSVFSIRRYLFDREVNYVK